MPVMNFLEGFKLMWSNKNFGLLAFIFAIKQGTLNTFGMLLSDILTPFGYTPDILAYFGILFLFGGMFGAIICTIVADRTKKFKVCLMFCCIGVAYSTLQFTVFIKDVDSFLV